MSFSVITLFRLHPTLSQSRQEQITFIRMNFTRLNKIRYNFFGVINRIYDVNYGIISHVEVFALQLSGSKSAVSRNLSICGDTRRRRSTSAGSRGKSINARNPRAEQPLPLPAAATLYCNFSLVYAS